MVGLSSGGEVIALIRPYCFRLSFLIRIYHGFSTYLSRKGLNLRDAPLEARMAISRTEYLLL